jgi:two-component system OmpR family sensor kinase
VSLRTRLLLAVGAVALVALLVADIVTYSSLQSFLLGRVDQQLLMTLGHNGPGGPLPFTPGGDADQEGQPGVGQAGGLAAAPGTFVEIRDADGTVTLKVPATENGGTQYSPALPAHVTSPSGESGAPQVLYFYAPSTTTGGPEFRVQVSTSVDGDQIILALPLDNVDATLHRLLLVEGAVTLAALAAAMGLGWWLVKVGLRPLDDVEETADAIAGGALGRRVPGEDNRTEVGRLARALNVMLARIQQAFAERDATEAELRASEDRLRRFVADASHELRTPAAAISAYAELFSRGASSRPEDLERVMQGIRGESARMGSLVQDLLLLARLDEGRELERTPVELVELATEARDAAVAVGPDWPVRLEASAPVDLVGDRLRLRQVLDNLLANVRAHTPPGTTTVVRVARQGGEAVVEVTDDGPGLTDEQAALAFERFYRADPSRSRTSGGSGLGLSIVAAIVASAGGTATAGRGPGGGASFTVRLPLTPGVAVGA